MAGAGPLTGALEYNARYTRSDTEQGSQSSQSQTGTLRLSKGTYLWEPWFAQVNASVGLSLSQTSGGSTGTRTGEFVSGDVRFSLLPQSRFPFQLWATRRDSRLSSDEDATPDTGRTVTRYGFTQHYRALGGGSYNFRLEKRVSEQSGAEEGEDRDEHLNWKLEGRENFGEHDLSLRLEQDDISRVNDDRRDRRQNLTLRHRFTPDESTISVNNLASAIRRKRSSDVGSSQFDREQLSSTAVWRSGGDQRLSLNSSVRASQSRADASHGQLLALDVGASYRWSDRWSANAGSGVTSRQSEGGGREESDLVHRHRASVDYSSRERQLLGFDHRWNAGLQGGYRSDGDTDSTRASISGRQSVSRNLARGSFGSLDSRLNQSVSRELATEDEPGTSLTHGGSLRWQQQQGERNAYGDLQFTDSRQYEEGELTSAFQLANLQLSMSQRLSGSRYLSANATLQASRTLAGSGSVEDDGWQPSSSVDVSYRQQGLFGLYRLSWRSDLRYTSDNIFNLIQREDGSEEQDSIRWENRLEYNIGKLSSQFSTTLSERDGALSQSYRLTLRRRF